MNGFACTVKNSTTKGLHVCISGRVQGVGFRYATRAAAVQLGLSGWVRNLHDGSVEAFFCGDDDALEQMLDWCRTGPPMAAVAHVEHDWQSTEPQHNRFRITG